MPTKTTTVTYTRRGVRLTAVFDNQHEAELFACYVLELANLEWEMWNVNGDLVRENDDGKPWSWDNL